ncbi:cell division protein FtsZ [Candidatus Methanomassiliicoccus intestinalis]|jgi:cell division protein ftsZ|uniref:Cell division protein FtsZ n=2 Tax=Candidatus Methanomassiliicoccus intestinalis TaxID=1406512 RepID=R9T8K3_METII|nr:cell division protein FtsZ [Candidatus Methanomassiliicoccus intestinalis]AGN27030.1 cell division protein FtsZ [Candidatus Methanomassiliicoccus intestinalis Issoire-Mx1]TQS80993.1 MAG: cell division protein FtsZ [Candidatus Methanomassiliicoccus intestinalis]TQS83987.1 MAG: cell division protein FtsZ [Candidatus Methanomassiliicoccus intestinalis]
MKSFINDAISRASMQATDPSQIPESESGGRQFSAEDQLLLEVLESLRTNIKIIGCGGGGTNTIDRLSEVGVTGAEVYAANTDAQHLLAVHSPNKLLLGRRITRGLGAGALPRVGEDAAREAELELRGALDRSDIVFVTAGMGGGTGTGSAPYVAKLAKDMGALTVAVVTYPFKAEGNIRSENAEWGLERLRESADTVIVIPNDKLLEICPRLAINEAFKVADEVLVRAIKGITELITKPGLVNLDFNDVKTIMKGAGVAMIGLGESDSNKNRVEEAIDAAINSPLIDVDISEATGVLVNITGGNNMSISEAERVASVIQSRVSPNARIIWGAAVDPELGDAVRVMVVITGVKSNNILGPDRNRVKTTAEDVDFID